MEQIKVPALPESVSEATLAVWNVSIGDNVEKDQIIAELETDKVMLEIPAVASGVISDLLVSKGDTVLADAVLGKIDTSAIPTKVVGDDTEDIEALAKLDEKVQELAAEIDSDDNTSSIANASGNAENFSLSGEPTKDKLTENSTSEATSQPKTDTKDTDRTKADKSKARKQTPKSKSTPSSNRDNRQIKRIEMTRLQKTGSRRLLESSQQTASLTTFNELDMHAIINFRRKFGEEFLNRHEVKLGFMGFFVKAAVEALKKFPIVNAKINGENILYHEYCDIGVAVASKRGLVVPILKNAHDMSLQSIEHKIADLSSRAQEGKLAYEEISGGTFTITNGGVFGSMMSTPILNVPQSAILGMHKITEKPVVVDGAIVIRPMMYLALTYDHRLIDGKDAVQFLVSIKNSLEDPSRLFLSL